VSEQDVARAGRNPPPANINWRSDRHVIPPDASHAAESAMPLEQDSITRAWPLEKSRWRVAHRDRQEPPEH